MTVADCLYFQIHDSSGQITELAKEGSSIVIGRRSKVGTRLADLFVDDQYVSRRHSRVFRNPEAPDQWLLEDIGSNNGTRLSGVPVTAAVPIEEGAWIQIGTTRLTFSRQPKYATQEPEAAATVVAPVLSIDGDATVVRPRDTDATVVRPREEDATVMRPRDRDATIVRPREEDATVVRPRDTDATVVCPRDTDATVVRPRDADATVVRTATFLGTRVSDSDATMLHPSRTALTMPSTATERATVATPTIDGPSSAKSRSLDGASLGGAEHVVTDDEVDSHILREEMSLHHETHFWPTRAIPSMLHMNPLQISIHSGMIQSFIQANFLDDIRATELLETAQKRGQTFFRTLLYDESVQNILEKILADVAETFDLEYIRRQEDLTPQVMEAEWLPFSRAKELGCVLLKTDTPVAGKVCYGALDPFDITLRDWVERCSHASTRCVMIHPETFSSVMQSLKGKSGENDDVGISIDFSTQDEAHIRDQIQDVNVPQMVNYFLYRAHFQGASDIHIEPTEELLLVRMRVDGILHQEISLPMSFHSEMASRLKILSGMDVVEKRRPQDGRLAVVIRNNPIDVRVSSYPTVFGEKFVLRLLDKNALRPSIETLGLMERDRRLLREKLAAPYGLVMISGPTGSGKTTTLYSCLGGMDRNKKNVLTVEDPVEYRMAGIHQMQVNAKIGLTFASGLRTILRQDPDVIMVGETRDGETAAMAIQASLTGHIVFSTIHTNDAVGVITRLLDMGIEPFLVSTALSLAVAQRLVRTLCKHCRVPVSGRAILDQLQKEGVTKERLQLLDIHIDPEVDYTQGAGCSHCRNSGYQGRRAVFEMFEMTDEARNLIMSGGINATKLKALAKEKGMTTLIAHGIQLVEEEVTTFEEVLRVLGEEG
ncbi:MAG: Flp pilus assembly complex ATPase component TadA [Magnetococcales bacterium]|nr:Flp pilus assembly complex ATPase component TadA [Magnetococcales bacterium]